MKSVHRAGWGRVLCVLALLSGVHCSRQPPAPPSKPAPPTPAFDASAVVRRARLAFRTDAEGWHGGHDTYAVRATREGFSFTPVHFPRESAHVRGAPVTFGAARLSRGTARPGSGRAQGHVEADGRLALARPEVVEHLRNGEQGVEQTWTFAAPPSGQGDLVVRVPVSGAAFLQETEAGLHFREARSGLGVRYGHGTWVDARGQRTPVPARHEAGAVVLRVPSAVLAASAWPAVLDPVVSPEVHVGELAYGRAYESQSQPTASFDGTNHLVVWADARALGGLQQPTAAHDIYGARVGPTGQVLDPAGFPIATAAMDEGEPTVSFDGTNHLVVWRGSQRIAGARVSPAGQVLDPGGIPISTAPGDKLAPRATFDGTNHFIVWGDQRDANTVGQQVFAARVSPEGQVLDPAGINLGPGSQPVAASDGTNTLVAWNRNNTLEARRVSRSGELLDSMPLRLGLAPGNPGYTNGLSFDGTNYLAVWSASDATGDSILGVRVSPAGQVLGAAFIIARTTGRRFSPVAAFDGTNHLVLWEDSRVTGNFTDLYAARVSPAGTVLDPSGIAVTPRGGGQERARLVFAGTHFLVVWMEVGDIRGARISAAGQVLDHPGWLLSTASYWQQSPVAAFDGTNHLLVWAEERHSSSPPQFDLYGARVSAAGQVLDPAGFVISAAARDQWAPAVTFDGTNYLVVWEDQRTASVRSEIYAARVSRSGVVLDPAGLRIRSGFPGYYYSPAVASDGTSSLIVWADGNSNSDIRGVRLSAAGQVLDSTPLTISSGFDRQQTPAVVFDGTNYFVVWRDFRLPGAGIYGARVSRTGAVLEDPYDGLLLHGDAGNYFRPAVATDGAGYLVAWLHHTHGIQGTRVSLEGTVLGTPITFAPGVTRGEEGPKVAFDGTHYFVVWKEWREGTGYDVLGTRMRPDGTLRETSLVVAGEPGEESAPAVTATDRERYLVAYQRFDGAPHGSQRVRARTVRLNDSPQARSESLAVDEDGARALTLTATDPEGDTLTYAVLTGPTHGRLTGTPPALTYTPHTDYHGPDSFTFTASDHASASEPATVSLTVLPVNDPPEARSRFLTTSQGDSPAVTLEGSDVDGDALTFAVATGPSHGTLSGTPPALTYTPAPGFRGEDGFTFTASDGTRTSAPGTVRLTVRNAAPRVTAVSASTLSPLEGQPVAFTATTADPGQDALTHAWSFGDGATSTEAAPSHAYATPGMYTVTLTVSDGLTTASARLSLVVGNVAPVVDGIDGADQGREAAPLGFQARARDSRPEGLTYAWDWGDGTPASTGAQASHAWADDGTFTVTLTVTDAAGARGTASHTVVIQNATPVPVQPGDRQLDAGSTVSLRLHANDPAGAADALTWTLVEGPGTLSAAGDYTWTPQAADSGPHTVRARVEDGDGGQAEVRFEVRVFPPVGPEGNGGCGCGATPQAGPPVLLALLSLVALARRRRSA